jgi:hypothetical protein
MELATALAVLSVLLWLNIKATRLVLRDSLSERMQRIAQVLLVWLVPLVGALIVLAVHRRTEPPSQKYREALEPGDDYAYSGRALKATREALDGND